MKPEVKALIDRFVENIPKSKTPEGKAESDRVLNEAMSLTVTVEEKKEAGQYLTKAMCRRRRPDIDAKELMKEVTPALSLSYIAENYFGKGKSWLYQRINNSVVNGKPTSFTQDELKILADSLGDLSNRLSALSLVIHRSL
ncbi:DUF5053 domain-containing protein [Bacteroides timonensis]|uniref:DUF5053 domain-containing protein n=1 Tax=Bacteroides timonensis TaxID=1470345 RepID=UPI0004B1EAFA|nr:DUF5053 domain-containing protein [Bacteroides timonensis]